MLLFLNARHGAQVDYEQFAALLRLRQGIHKLAVALDFFQNTMGALNRDDFRRAARKVAGKDIAQHVVRSSSCMHSHMGKHVMYIRSALECTIRFVVAECR